MVSKTETLERVYNIPLRASFRKCVRMKKANKAIRAVKAFLKKHMKADVVKLGNHINETVWARGIRSPPHHVKVLAIKDADGVVKAELDGFKWEEAVKPLKKDAPQGGLAGKLKGLKSAVDAKEVVSDKKEDKKDTEKEKTSPAKKVAKTTEKTVAKKPEPKTASAKPTDKKE